MPNKTNMQTAVVLQLMYAAIRLHMRYDRGISDYYCSVYASYTGDTDCSASVISRYYTGDRTIPRAMMSHYAAYHTDTPRCPPRLCADLYNYISDGLQASARRAIYDVLCVYISQLPDADRQLLEEDYADISYMCVDQLASMWSAVLWYAMCADRAHGARDEGGGIT